MSDQSLKQILQKCCMWDIRKTREELEDEVCRTIIIVHAILRCETTSTVFGRGKAVYLKKVMKSPHFFQLFKRRVPLWRYKLSEEGIIKAGGNALVSLFNGKYQDNLDNLCCQRFTEKVLSRVRK